MSSSSVNFSPCSKADPPPSVPPETNRVSELYLFLAGPSTTLRFPQEKENEKKGRANLIF